MQKWIDVSLKFYLIWKVNPERDLIYYFMIWMGTTNLTKHRWYVCNNITKQENIPVGCLPTAAVAFTPGGKGRYLVHPLVIPTPKYTYPRVYSTPSVYHSPLGDTLPVVYPTTTKDPLTEIPYPLRSDVGPETWDQRCPIRLWKHCLPLRSVIKTNFTWWLSPWAPFDCGANPNHLLK